jgi:alkaline phosphatase
MIESRKLRYLAILVCVCLLADVAKAAPKNVILLIGDGMGFEHLKAASLFAHGGDGRLVIQRLPVSGECTTDPAGMAGIPDSACTGTALATGEKVARGVVSVRLPGDGEDLPTLLEKLAKQGRRTGLVTTANMGDATPAAFGAHVKFRALYEEVYEDYFERSKPNLIFGGAWRLPEGAPEKAGYTVVKSRNALEALMAGDAPERICGPFCPSNFPYEWEYANRINHRYDRVPHLSEMTRAALAILSQGGKGFFLMVEGARIDHASHANHIHSTVMETLEFDNAVEEVLRWAAGRQDTLVLVTADHECGGLAMVESRGLGEMPEVTWATGGHTKAPVPLFAWGVGADRFAGKLDNTDVPGRILDLPESDPDVEQAAVMKLLSEY